MIPDSPVIGLYTSCVGDLTQYCLGGVDSYKAMADKIIDKDKLRIGMFVHLDLPWMKHPFVTGSFKIRNQQQLDTLKRLQIKSLRVDPSKSDVAPAKTPPPAPSDSQTMDAAAQAMWEEKKRRIKALKQRRVRLNRCAKRYTQSVGSARKLMSHLMSSPQQAVDEADQLVHHMVEELTIDRDATVQLVNMKSQDENTYFHAINVAALALVLGNSLALDADQLKLLGMSALFHDLGHQKIPYQILHKKTALSRAERQLYERHPIYGGEIAAHIGTLPKDVVDVIVQHHEYLDGSGFPQGLQGDRICAHARIITVVNRYDNLCNGAGGGTSVSPYEAISRMYSRERERYDAKILTTFISNLGVYPPGTVVKLEDERIASVLSINPAALLKPNVLVYTPDIPKDEALILNLEEEELNIKESVRTPDLPTEVLDYLNITDTVSYYFDSASRKPTGG